MMGILNRAADAKKSLEIIYVDGKGNMTQRKIRVVEVRENQILAYCYCRNQVRLFSKDGILSVFPCNERKSVVI
ncbi:hypothetical protein [Halobacillus sp. H74]|uniref:hypothetical protein n=1 Tax=Halobacillus sp. H74 TaxID=3457436 RepID=UPI003FCD70EE